MWGLPRLFPVVSASNYRDYHLVYVIKAKARSTMSLIGLHEGLALAPVLFPHLQRLLEMYRLSQPQSKALPVLFALAKVSPGERGHVACITEAQFDQDLADTRWQVIQLDKPFDGHVSIIPGGRRLGLELVFGCGYLLGCSLSDG